MRPPTTWKRQIDPISRLGQHVSPNYNFNPWKALIYIVNHTVPTTTVTQKVMHALVLARVGIKPHRSRQADRLLPCCHVTFIIPRASKRIVDCTHALSRNLSQLWCLNTKTAPLNPGRSSTANDCALSRLKRRHVLHGTAGRREVDIALIKRSHNN